MDRDLSSGYRYAIFEQPEPGQLVIVYNFQITNMSTIFSCFELIDLHCKNWRKKT